jgi:hypothetical protein
MDNESKKDNSVLLVNRLKAIAVVLDLNIPYSTGQQTIILGYNDIIEFITKLRNYIKAQNQLNSQQWLDFEDNLNKISIADPNN